MGEYLLKYVELEENKSAQAELFAKAAAEAAEAEAAAAAAEAAAKAEAERLAAGPPGQAELEEQLASAKEVAELYPAVLEMVKAATGATSCYIGVKAMSAEGAEGEPAMPTITWLAGSEGSAMEGCSQTGASEEDPEGQPAEGVTFALFVGAEPPEPAEGEEPPEDGAEPGLVYPEELVVPNVVRDPAVKFFGVPKIGAYAALPIKYKSCLHADGIGEKEAEEGGEAGKAPVFNPTEMVLGMHTMGQAGRQFTLEELAAAKGWAGKVAAALERAELTLWGAEVEKVEVATVAEASVGEGLAGAKAAAEAAAEEAIAALPEDMPEAQKDWESKKLGYGAALAVMGAAEAQLAELLEKRLPPKPEQVRILHALLVTLLVPKEAFVEPSTRKVNWEKMRKFFDASLAAKIKKYDPSSEKNAYPRYARVEDMRRMLEVEEMPTEALYTAVFDWCTKATDCREAAVVAREAAAEAAAAAAAAEAELEGEAVAE